MVSLDVYVKGINLIQKSRAQVLGQACLGYVPLGHLLSDLGKLLNASVAQFLYL